MWSVQAHWNVVQPCFEGKIPLTFLGSFVKKIVPSCKENVSVFVMIQVMEILHMEEKPAKHILKRWTKDTRDILPQHLVQYQKDNPVNMSFTCRHPTLFLKAMEVVRLGDSSAEAFDHLITYLVDLKLSW
uniref:Uncharacterized protein n=1 Tax=Aegilops tauschii subsp. strangulata TaxID=200361 RepID=A0A453F5W5_AEGTS